MREHKNQGGGGGGGGGGGRKTPIEENKEGESQ